MRTTLVCVTCRASSSSRLKRRSMSGRRRRIRGRLGPDHLERDGDAELLIPGLVDGAHAAHAEQLDDVIARAERLAHRERAGIGRAAELAVARAPAWPFGADVPVSGPARASVRSSWRSSGTVET